MKNILIVSPREVNPMMGGIERVSDALARRLMQEGYCVVFLSDERSSTEPYTPCTTQYLLDSDHSKRQTQLLDVIRIHKISVIINQVNLFSIMPRELLPDDVKVISVIHDSHYSMYHHMDMCWLRKIRWKYIVSKGLKYNYRQSDKVVLFSEKFIPEFQFFYKDKDASKFVIIPNFNSYISVQELEPKQRKVLFVGRLSFGPKRPDYLLHIWSKVCKKYPDWQLQIVGDGDYMDKVNQLAIELKLTNCSFEGQQDPRPYYEQASIFCLTSAYESFGMVVTEAMQHGAVPLAFNSYSTAPEIIADGEDGFLIKPFDLDAYADKLEVLMTDNALRNQMSKKAKRNVQKFSHIEVGKQWVQLIESL